MFFIVNEHVFRGKSSSDKVKQRMLHLKNKQNDYYQQYLLETIEVHLEKMRVKNSLEYYTWITSIFWYVKIKYYAAEFIRFRRVLYLNK